jgi:hypothetical protein
MLVPIGRGSELNREIESKRAQLKEMKERIRLRETQIEKQGGSTFAPSHLVTQSKAECEEAQTLESVIGALDQERRLQSRYEIELGTLAPLRGELAIAQGYQPDNAHLLAVANRLYPGLFNRESVLLGLSPDHLARQFEGVAAIEQERERLEQAASVSDKTPLLKIRLANLLAARTEKQPGDLPPFVDNSHIKLPQLANGSSFFDITLGQDWYHRISLIRLPSTEPSEFKGGLNLREIYRPNTLEKARLTLIYYRAWSPGPFSLSDNRDLQTILLQLEKQLCSRFCRECDCEQTSHYRLPNCALFLRFYDETELTEDRLQTYRLLHIPFCRVLDAEAWSMTPAHKNVLDEDGILHNHSIPDWMFGELFNRKMVGSAWIDNQHLHYIYRVLKSVPPQEVSFIMHSQIYKLGSGQAPQRKLQA